MAFTLSETLIALVIIGIIAAITVPAVVVQIENRSYKTAYREAYRDFNLAFYEANVHGYFPEKNGNCYDAEFAQFTWNIMKNKFNIMKTCENNNGFDCWVDADRVYDNTSPANGCKAFVDASGRVWIEFEQNRSIYLVDVNGDKGPNRFGKDRWQFGFHDKIHQRAADCTVIPEYGIETGPRAFQDITTTGSKWCNHPPCYYKSWLAD